GARVRADLVVPPVLGRLLLRLLGRLRVVDPAPARHQIEEPPFAVPIDRILEELPDVAEPPRPRLIELLEPDRVLAAVLLLVREDGVHVLRPPEDQLLLAVPPPGRAPGLRRDAKPDHGYRHPDHDDDQDRARVI